MDFIDEVIDQIRKETAIGGNRRERIANALQLLRDNSNNFKEPASVSRGKLSMRTNGEKLYFTDSQNKEQEIILSEEFRASVNTGITGTAELSTVPSSTKYERWKIAMPGTYPNFLEKDSNGNNVPITITPKEFEENEITLSVTNGIAKKEFSKKINSKIETWSAKPFEKERQVYYFGDVYEALENVTKDDIPGISQKWKILTHSIDVDGGVTSYHLTDAILNKYIIKGTSDTITTIGERNAVFGGKFLKINDGLDLDPNYPAIGVIYKLDIRKATKLIVSGLISAGGNPEERVIIGGYKKDGTYVVFQRSDDPDLHLRKEFDITDFATISVQVNKNSFPYIAIKGEYDSYVDLGSYLDDKLKVLDYFVNPKKNELVPITMPTTGEIDNAFLTTSMDQFQLNGFANGVIDLSTVPENYTKIRLDGDFTGVGVGVLWIALYRQGTGDLLQLLSGASDKKIFEFEIDRNRFDRIAYSRKKNSTFFNFIDTTPVDTKQDSVKVYIDDKASGGGGASFEHLYIDAYTEFNVSPNKTAAENSVNLNKATLKAHLENKPLLLPAGIIEHEGFMYYQNVVMRGTGLMTTTLKSTTPTAALKTPRGEGDPYFSLAVGEISDMTIDGNNIGTVALDLTNMSESTFENLLIKKFTQYCIIGEGLLMSWFKNVFVHDSTNGILLKASSNSGFGPMQPNFNVFQKCSFQRLKNIGIEIYGAAMLTLRDCSVEKNGTPNNDATGFIKAYGISPLEEGVDITIEGVWSEICYGGFWLDISSSNGVTTFRDSIIWALEGGCKKAIVNNGCKVLITGSTKVKGFSTTGIETKNNGVTRVDGFANIDTHTENSGGVYKIAQYS